MGSLLPAFERRVGRAVAAMAIATLLSGCYTLNQPSEPISNDYHARHPISIAEKDRTVVLFIGTNRGGLTPAQRADVLAFAQAWKREGTGGIVVDVPTKTPNAHAAADAMREVQSILNAAEVPAPAVHVQPYVPEDIRKLASIKLNYPRITADAGPCGLWPKDLGPDTDLVWQENRPYWNLGCASQRNLAAMVDNPADLVQPRGETPAYTPRRSVVLDKYRKGESTATNYPNPNQGKISSVGQ